MLSNYLMQATPQIEAVIFDLDDTLISWADAAVRWSDYNWFDYLAPMMKQAAQFLGKNGVHVDAKVLGKNFGRTLQESWQAAHNTPANIAVSLAGLFHTTLIKSAIDPDSIDIQALMNSFSGQPMPGIECYPDTHAVLTELKQRGYKIGLITNSFSPMWIRDFELAHYGLTDYFDARITSGDTGFMKPDPAIYWRMMGMLNTTPNKALFVGDSPSHDILGANRTGLVSVLIDPPHLNKVVETPEQKADHTINSLDELLALPFFVHNS